MSAPLTVQVRLGFSLGWRIWTPNEVRFYTKTLAHSYFIYTILRSKLLMAKIWIVNYSIFMGINKYLIFIEYLRFGLKHKEEGLRWNKLTYLSLALHYPKGRFLKLKDKKIYKKYYRKYKNTKLKRKLEKKIGKRAVKYFFRSRDRKNIKLNSKSKRYINFLKIKKSLIFKKLKLKQFGKQSKIKNFNFFKIKPSRLKFLKRQRNEKYRKLLNTFLEIKSTVKYSKKIRFTSKLNSQIINFKKLKFKKWLLSNFKNFFTVSCAKKILSLGTQATSNDKIHFDLLNNNLRDENLYLKRIRFFFRNNKSTPMNILKSFNYSESYSKPYLSSPLIDFKMVRSAFLQKKKKINKKKYLNSPLATNPPIRIKEVKKSGKFLFHFYGGLYPSGFRKLQRAYSSKQILTLKNLVWFWQKLAFMVVYFTVKTIREDYLRGAGIYGI